MPVLMNFFPIIFEMTGKTMAGFFVQHPRYQQKRDGLPVTRAISGTQ
jgi:hypothetical protein